MLKQLAIICALGSATILVGCQGMQPTTKEVQTAESLQLLQNRTWIATQIGNTAIKTTPQNRNVPSLKFDEATKNVSGSDGCNRLVGAYNAGQDTLQLSQIASTRMACLNNGNIDSEFNQAIAKVTHYQTYGKTLKLLDRYGNLLIQFESAVQPR